MKNLLTLLLFVTTFTNTAAQKMVKVHKSDSCKRTVSKYYAVIGEGYVLHRKCKMSDMVHNLFIHLNTRKDSVGKLLNWEYTIEEPSLKVKPIKGSDFLIVDVRGKPRSYRYTFETDSWVELNVVIAPATRVEDLRY